jgi:hypothetical protein
MNWSPRELVVETSDNWAASMFNYPIFLSADMWSNTAVDLNNFYILGTHSESPFINPVSIMNISRPAPQAMNTMVASAGTQAPSVLVAGAPGAPAALYPNPTHGDIQLNYFLGASAKVQVNLLDMTGRAYILQAPVPKAPGSYQEHFDLSNFARGVYIVELIADSERKIFKVVHE